MEFKFDYDQEKNTIDGTRTTFRFYRKENDGNENCSIKLEFWGPLPSWIKELGIHTMKPEDPIQVSFDTKLVQKTLD